MHGHHQGTAPASRGAALVALVAAALLVACSPPAATTERPAAAQATSTTGPAASRPAAAGASAAAPERQSVSFGSVQILAMGPLYIANDRGYFAEQGIDFELIPFDSGALAVAPTAAGQIDMIQSPLSPGFLNALARGIDLTGISSTVYAETVLLVRKELWDSGEVRSAPDLRGKRVSFNIEGSVVDYALRRMLPQLGVNVADVEVQRLANSDLGAALVNGAVEAGVVSDPTPLESRGIATRLAGSFDVIGRQTAALLVVGPSMRAKGDAPTRFLVAYLKAVRDLDLALQANKVADPQILAILARWTNIPAETIAQTPFAENIPNARIDFEDLDQQQDFWIHEGMVPSRTDIRQFVDTKYLDAALAQQR